MKQITLRVYWVLLSTWVSLLLGNSILGNSTSTWFDMKSEAEFKQSQRKIRDIVLEASTYITKNCGHKVEIKESDYLLFGDSIIFNPDGTHFLYSYHPKRKTFIRLDNSEFHGHNFGRRLFIYKGDIYAIGGYGFWISHCKIIRYNWISREWDLVNVTGPLPLPAPGATIVYGDTLFLYGVRDPGSTQVYKDPILDYSVFWINLKTWKSEQRSSTAPIPAALMTQSINDQRSKYTVFAYMGNIERIFDKVSGRLYHSFSGPSLYNGIDKKYHNYQDSILSFLMGSDILIIDKYGNERMISVPEYIKLYCNPECSIREIKEYKAIVKRDVKEQFMFPWSYLWILLLCISWTVFGFFYFRNSMGMTNKLMQYYRELDNTEIDFAEIRRFMHGDYSEKEIDLFLRIDHLPRIVKNVKRSKLMFEINEKFPGYIEKISTSGKKQTFHYRIKHH